MKGGDGDLSLPPGDRTRMLRSTRRDAPPATRGTRKAQALAERLSCRHLISMRSTASGAGPKQRVFFSSADKSREEKDANISGMCPAAFCASTLEYNTNVTKKDSTE